MVDEEYASHLVRIQEIIHRDEHWCVVMEFCSKGDLTSAISKGPVSEVMAKKMFPAGKLRYKLQLRRCLYV